MGTAFLLKRKILCQECYQEEIDYLAGREEAPPVRMVDAPTCDRCHAELEREEYL
jgi:hypothetical protein